MGATGPPKIDPFFCAKSFACKPFHCLPKGVGARRQLPPFLPPRTVGFRCISRIFVHRYSKRRISTGNRRDAARAGSKVAPTDITIAATVIQTPSQTLG